MKFDMGYYITFFQEMEVFFLFFCIDKSTRLVYTGIIKEKKAGDKTMCDKKKLLIVCEKPSCKAQLAGYFKGVPGFLGSHEVFYDYFGSVMDVRSCPLPFYRHSDGWYLYGEPSGFMPLFLPGLDIPDGSYVVAYQSLGSGFSLEDMDEILFACGGPDAGADVLYADDVLAARKYMEVTGLEFSGRVWCMRYQDMSRESLGAAFAGRELFGDVYLEVRDYLVANGFPYRARTDTAFEEVLFLSGMKLSAFCQYFGIPRRTAENWKYGKAECPGYLLGLMKYKLEKESII